MTLFRRRGCGSAAICTDSLDINSFAIMPGLNGIETVERLRQFHPELKAIIASGFATEETSAKAAVRHMKWLAKPYTLQILADTVQEVPGDAKAIYSDIKSQS